MDFKTYSFTIDNKGTGAAYNDGAGFSGYASTFGNVDSDGDIIMPGAFTDTIPEFLESGFVAWQHQWDNPIGKPVEAYEDSKGLYVSATISDTQQGRDARQLILDGVVRKMSIGFRTLKSRQLSEDEGKQILGDDGYEKALKSLPFYAEGIRAIEKVQLFEFSPVSLPANAQALITAAKDSGSESPFNDHLLSMGSALDAFVTRLEHKVATRTRDGRSLSQAQLEQVEDIHSSLERAYSVTKGLLEPPVKTHTKEEIELEMLRHKYHKYTRAT
jgi:HK97 family phage prohead protease